MPDGHCADPSLPLHLDQGRGGSKKEPFSLRASPALHPPERPSPRRADMAGDGHGPGDAGTEQHGLHIRTRGVRLILAKDCGAASRELEEGVCALRLYDRAHFW